MCVFFPHDIKKGQRITLAFFSNTLSLCVFETLCLYFIVSFVVAVVFASLPNVFGN